MSNQFLALRARRLSESTHAFRARGKSVLRCPVCLLAEYACLCAYRPELQSRSEFILLMHPKELVKPTNTGRLIADVLPGQTHISVWSRHAPDERTFEMLVDSTRRCCVVYPDTQVPVQSVAHLSEDDKINTYLLLDGTWKQGRRMLTLSRWLDGVPRLSLPESLLRGYAVRKSQASHQLATAEAAALCLGLSGETLQSDVLLDYFALFNHHYLATRSNRAPEVLALHDKLRSK